MNVELKKAKRCEYRKRNRDVLAAKCKIWRSRNKAKIQKWNFVQNSLRKAKVLVAYGGKCANPSCGDDDIATLSLDHVNDDGYAKREYLGSNFYARLLKEPRRDDLQVLCMSCQFKKRRYGSDTSAWASLKRTPAQILSDIEGL